MKKIYITLVIVFTSICSFAQTGPQATIDSVNATSVKNLFNYLLQSARLNIKENDNITLQELVNDATGAGFSINTSGASIFNGNLNKKFFTLTPAYVQHDGLLVVPNDSAYKAMIGDAMIIFTATGGWMESRIHALRFLRKNANNQMEYTLTDLPQYSYDFTIKHRPDEQSLPWFVRYTGNDGLSYKQWFAATDTVVSVTGTAITLIQDADTINQVFATSIATVLEQPNSYVIDANNYYRSTVAVLQVIPPQQKPAIANTPLQIKVLQNPAYDVFRMNITSAVPGSIAVRIINADGKPMETYRTNGGTMQMGSALKSGFYYAEIIQGNQRKVVKLVKQ